MLLKLLGQLNRETDFLVIDNGSPDAVRFKESILAYSRCLEYRQLAENVGLAQALNYGLEEVQKRNYRFALLFDQDSSLGDLYVESMLAAYEEALGAGKEKVAAIGPRVINPQTRRQTPFKLFSKVVFRSDQPFCDNKHLFQADFFITSGTLLALSCLDDIGLMKASYFIDNVDLEWCFRAKYRGYALVGTDRAILYHAIGERSANPLVRRGLLAKHSPDRTYYSSRNRVHLYSAGYSPWGWKLRDCVRFAIKASWLILTSAQRKQYWQNITAGIRDARNLE
ncbi:MAG: glycosyltransferase [Gammaproteobacteria bacterium]|nr:glycosyltransferase [Gammaproteobacteria bacterium]